MTARLLHSHGVNRAVLSPGSRNAPLCMAFTARGDFDTRVVVDERSAAFMALGMAAHTGEPVAMCCTSGTAPLNYGPALAEAFYRQIPLIAVTADRPAHMIDILDSQTIRQPGIFANYVKGTFDIAAVDGAVERLNEAMNLAMSWPRGPVHVNVRIDEPVGAMRDGCGEESFPASVAHSCPDASSDIPARTGYRRILVVVGSHGPSSSLDNALGRLAARGVAIVVPPTASSGLDSTAAIGAPDLFFSVTPSVAPDLVVTLGGEPLSAPMKRYLRSLPGLAHWSVNQPGGPATYGVMPVELRGAEADVLDAICDALPAGDCDFGRLWARRYEIMLAAAEEYISEGPFTALSALRRIASSTCGAWLHLSTGMTVRYAQFAATSLRRMAGVFCNRGVSGIDGCTSTAIGASTATDDPVVLLSGDMSAQYDLGALATAGIPRNFRMAVLANGGGNIFRHIGATRELPCRDSCLVAEVRLPLRELAGAYGFGYYRADSAGTLLRAVDEWKYARGPAILEVLTDGPTDAENYINLFRYVKEKLDNNQGIFRYPV